MEAEFWHEKWQTNDIGFHQMAAHPMLVAHVEQLGLEPGRRLFLPLCGKTRDIAWLLSKGYRVAGAELSHIAVEQLFEELGLEPDITTIGALKCYRAKHIDIYVGDIFALTPTTLGPVDGIYDRAALVALPEAMRARYTEHVMQMTNDAPQLLITFEYDQRLMAGPPFSITADELRQHYGRHYAITPLASATVEGGLKGQCDAVEKVWLLQTPKN